MSSYDFTWKIMMLGEEDAGKTSLTIRYISGFFLEDLKLTIGVDFYSKTTSYNEKKVKLQIWDFGGEERFRFLLHQYCKGANGAFLLYNITVPSSFNHLSDWTQIIREHAGDIPIMLVGTNAHLKEQRVITREQGIHATRIHNLSGFIEVSSKTGQNVEKLFDAMTETLFYRYRPNERRDNTWYPTSKGKVEPFFIKSKVREYIKANNLNTSSGVLDGEALNEMIVWFLDKACERAKRNGRKTVEVRDL